MAKTPPHNTKSPSNGNECCKHVIVLPSAIHIWWLGPLPGQNLLFNKVTNRTNGIECLLFDFKIKTHPLKKYHPPHTNECCSFHLRHLDHITLRVDDHTSSLSRSFLIKIDQHPTNPLPNPSHFRPFPSTINITHLPPPPYNFYTLPSQWDNVHTEMKPPKNNNNNNNDNNPSVTTTTHTTTLPINHTFSIMTFVYSTPMILCDRSSIHWSQQNLVSKPLSAVLLKKRSIDHIAIHTKSISPVSRTDPVPLIWSHLLSA